MTTVTEQTAALICEFGTRSPPDEAIYQSKLAIRDCLGVTLAGFDEPVAKIIRSMALEVASSPQATIWGTTHRMSALDAALANGAAAHALDYDDHSRVMLSHPSAVLAPALIALAESRGLSGNKVLEAYILGFQVMTQIGRLFGPEAYEKSWHPTAIVGVMGSCAGAAYLLGLDHKSTMHAIGIAASEASSIKKNFGSMTKPLHIASAARKGIWAAQLAANGLTAGSHALDGQFGFFENFHGCLPVLPPDADWNMPLEILATGVVYKQYPCCGGLHALIDNAITLRDVHRIEPVAIEYVECRLHPSRVLYLDRPNASEGLDAKFSIQYCVAAALLEGRIRLNDFTAESVARPAARALMKCVRVVGDGNLAAFGSATTVRMKDGRSFTEASTAPRGAPELPLTEDDLRRKFIDCATEMLGAQHAAEAATALMHIDRFGQASEIAAALVPQS